MSPSRTAEVRSVAFCGLGVMGAPMAANLARAGLAVRAWNRTPNRPGVAVAREAGCTIAPTLAEAVADVDCIITCVSDVPDVEEVLLGSDGVAAHAAQTSGAALVVDCSTIGPDAARSIGARLTERALGFLDAPVSGGDIGARAGTLTFMVGGEDEDFERARPLFEIMGRTIRHCGPTGAGQAVKMANQILCAANMVGIAEAVALAESQGIDPALAVEVCSTGAAGSWALENLGPRAVRGDFEPGFMVKDILKDLRLVREGAARAGIGIEGTDWATRMFEQTRDLDDGAGARMGTQAMVEAYRRRRRESSKGGS